MKVAAGGMGSCSILGGIAHEGRNRQASGIFRGSRHWLGNIFSGANMEDPTKGWKAGTLCTYEKSYDDKGRLGVMLVNDAGHSRVGIQMTVTQYFSYLISRKC